MVMAKAKQDLKECCGLCKFVRFPKPDKLECWVLPPFHDNDYDVFRNHYEPKSLEEPACLHFVQRMQS